MCAHTQMNHPVKIIFIPGFEMRIEAAAPCNLGKSFVVHYMIGQGVGEEIPLLDL